jgi:hypothetical protein
LVGLTRGTSARDFFTKALGLGVIVITPGAHSVEKLEADMKAERRKSRQAQAREKLWHASLRAEDEAVAHLHNFHPAVAFATACSVEQALAIKWEAEQEEMRRRRDPRKVMCISAGRVRELDVALASLPQGVHADAAAERRLLQILKDLPSDRAWWISHLVVRYQDVQFQMSQLPRSECRPDEDIETAIRIPDVVRRAAAGTEPYYTECGT